MDEQEIVEELTQDIFSYVMHGDVSEDFAVNALTTDFQNRFVDYGELVQIHFLLQDDVREFVEHLPERIRNIKTETRRRTETRNGSIEGRIDWSETFRERGSKGGNRALFVCETRNEHYDTPENMVLKRLLRRLDEALSTAENSDLLERDWMSDWTHAEEAENLVDRLRHIFRSNVHVRRIGDERDNSISRRQIERASTSRNPVYRDAAELLSRYRDLMDGDRESIKELLENSVVLPDDNPTRFELYVLFRYISAIENLKNGSFRVETIRSGKQLVAGLDGDTRVSLYHDTSGPDNLSFRKEFLDDPAQPGTDEYEEKSKLKKVEILSKRSFEQYMDREETEYTGRPDVIVLEVSNGDSQRHLITEVKYSNRKETIREGIREAHTYRAFLSDRSTDPKDFSSKGVLVIDDLDTADSEDRSCGDLEIVQARELEERSYEVLESVLSGD